ncbi:12937_t:CDS:2 [Ambispora gerdemannii]|uniref:12937_t:CDS:1 n=1 Tax=Ambispora gerdemannii TaxID=144530 RepID=A0A9N9GK22_9GLOM|nr:12937_t:CDS:2 [Ambispora gerdemannii]
MGNQHSKKLRRRNSKQFAKEISSSSADDYPNSTDSSFLHVNGRKFYRDAPCVFPVEDENETIRNEEKHTIVRLLFDGNFSAPIEDRLKAGGLKILDVGCGPGTWIIEMAKTYALCSFTGVDMSPNYFSRALPENVELIQADILKGLPIENGEFDFVVMHFLNGCFAIRQWESIIIPEIVRVMKPGAWLEWLECDAALKNQGENTKKMLQALLSLANSRGTNPWLVVEIPGILKNSGVLVNINTEIRAVKYCSPGKCGELARKGFISLFQFMKNQTMEFMSITSHEYDQLLVKANEELEQYQTINEYYRFNAQLIDNDSE